MSSDAEIDNWISEMRGVEPLSKILEKVAKIQHWTPPDPDDDPVCILCNDIVSLNPEVTRQDLQYNPIVCNECAQEFATNYCCRLAGEIDLLRGPPIFDDKVKHAIAFLRENWKHNNGAEGESVRLVCTDLEHKYITLHRLEGTPGVAAMQRLDAVNRRLTDLVERLRSELTKQQEHNRKMKGNEP